MTMSNGTPASQTSISKDFETLLDRLAKAEDRLALLGDRLHGPRPREGAVTPKDSPASIRRHVDALSDITGRIEDELAHIENSL